MNAGKKSSWLPWLFVGPSIILLLIYFVYPTLFTFYYSFTQGTVVNPAQEWVGLQNFVRLFTADPFFLDLENMQGAIINTAVWLIVFPFGTVIFGMLVAVLADKVRYENWIKSIIFLPMVVSATAASVIFRFVYNRDPNLGVLNAVLDGIPGYEPVGWLGNPNLANLAVIAAGVWIWTGLSMVVLSAAYKSLPKDVLESATVDGANAWQAFFRVSIPMMSRTILFVLMTMVINALKMIDLVLVMTQGGPQGSTRVIGFTVFWEMFNNQKLGYGSAVAVILFILITPFIIIQIRNVRAEVR